jgi:hypothetical protein
MNDSLLKLVEAFNSILMQRYFGLGGTGLLDPEYHRIKFLNPRYQEACLSLALSAKYEVAVPSGVSISDIEQAAIRSMDFWFRSLPLGGAIRTSPNAPLDSQSTAFGLFATAKTLILLEDKIPNSIKRRADKGIKKALRYLARTQPPAGIEPRAVRYAALMAAADWLKKPNIVSMAFTERNKAVSFLKTMCESDVRKLDSGGFALAFAYLVLGDKSRKSPDTTIYNTLINACLKSTTPTGIMGGGAEASLSCLPVPTGFYLTSNDNENAAYATSILANCFENGWYNGLVDPDVPWLTPLGYLCSFCLLDNNSQMNSTVQPSSFSDEILNNSGAGRIDLGDWTVRLGHGGTIGWIHHNPSESTRLFGSPSGFALREGPWMILGNRLRQPSLAGRFHTTMDHPITIEGHLYSLPIPGTERAPRRIGFPKWSGKQTKALTRLVPPLRFSGIKAGASIPYKREIEIKDGALTIETFVPGRLMHRVPLIWPGGLFGDITIDKEKVPVQRPFQARRIKEILFSGGPWPEWALRFDQPVDILYEPIHGDVSSSPMRFLSAAAGSIDIIANDRLHMAWRVG